MRTPNLDRHWGKELLDHRAHAARPNEQPESALPVQHLRGATSSGARTKSTPKGPGWKAPQLERRRRTHTAGATGAGVTIIVQP